MNGINNNIIITYDEDDDDVMMLMMIFFLDYKILPTHTQLTTATINDPN